MAKRILTFIFGVVLSAASVAAETFAEAGTTAHGMLTRLCDDFGGRPAGSAGNQAAMDRLVAELRELGLNPEKISFEMPGWVRGEDRAELIAPLARPLRVAALAYTEPCPPFEANVVSIGDGAPASYPADAKGKIGLLNRNVGRLTGELARIASEQGLRGILYINREGGGQLLARTSSFVGKPLSLPIFSITQEEGEWLQRLLARQTPVRVRMSSSAHSNKIQAANLRVVFPGKSKERVIVGAHFDSWDLGQGAMDNGLGIAQLYALARVLRDKPLERTVELHWFDGEEMGLWGSRHAAAAIGDTPIVAMINLDMVGVPIAVNALGDESLLPALERWNAARGNAKLAKGVENTNWFGSDHTPYQLAGVRTITFNAPIPRDSVRYYHDMADTIDKLPAEIVSGSTAIIGDLVVGLAADPELGAMRRAPEATQKMFAGPELEGRLRAQGLWPFP